MDSAQEGRGGRLVWVVVFAMLIFGGLFPAWAEDAAEMDFEFGDAAPTLAGHQSHLLMEKRTVSYPLLLTLLLAVAGGALVLVERYPAQGIEKLPFQVNILRGPLKAALRFPPTQFIIAAPATFFFILVIATGVWGVPIAGRNFATVMTWNIWWAALIFGILFFATIWCYMCPWRAIANWVKHLHPWRWSGRKIGWERPWPKHWRNIYWAAVLFLLLTWLELGFGITSRPLATALFALLMLGLTVVPALIFERDGFCRYACLVGRISGLYSLIAPMEVRALDRNVCRTCEQHDCYRGNTRGLPCPTGQYLFSMKENTYCISCAECIKSCPKDNVAIRVRPFAGDLFTGMKDRSDEAFLSLILFALTIFHSITMMPAWESATDYFVAAWNLPYLVAFSLLMAAIVAIPFGLFYTVGALARLAAGTSAISVNKTFQVFAYSLLPVTLSFHLAHNLAHLLGEGARAVIVASDPFGWGWNLFGTADYQVKALASHQSIGVYQIILVFIGMAFSLAVAHRAASRTFSDWRIGRRALIPMAAFITLSALFFIILLTQPMVMRSGM